MRLFDFLEARRLMAADAVEIVQVSAGDLNADGRVDAFDLQVIARDIATQDGRSDLNADGRVDALDLQTFAEHYAAQQSSSEEDPQTYRATVTSDLAERIGAYYDMGGTPSNTRRLAYNVEELGWQHVIETYVAPVAEAGVPFAEFHNIWGRDEDTAIMRFPLYGELVDDPELPKLIDGFVPAWQQFHAAHPEFETIAYVGAPYTSPTIRAIADDDPSWWPKVYETIVPLLEAGFTSLGFDASGWDGVWQHPRDLELFQVLMDPAQRDPVRDARLIEAVGDRPVTTYFEALPVNNRRHGMSDRAGSMGHDHMIITWQHYCEQDPDRLDADGRHTAKHPSLIANGERYGEMQEINVILPNSAVRGEPGDTWEEARAAALEAMRTVLRETHRNVTPSGNVRLLVHPRFLVDTGDNQRNFIGHAQGNYADLLAELDVMPPMRMELDLDGIHPDDATFTITKQPEHGTLVQSEHDRSVFVYVPDEGSDGVDSFEFVVG